MNTPTLSVVMPNYNHAHYIREALEAILDQSFRPLEVIVVDDGSTDDSVAVIGQFAMRDRIVRLLRNERNMGVVFTINRGLEHATGDYVYTPAADDKVLPGFFEKSMNLLSQYPQAGICSTDISEIDERGRPLHKLNAEKLTIPPFTPVEGLMENLRRYGLYISGVSTIFRRSVFIETGKFDPELSAFCDWLAIYAIAFRTGACYIPETLASMRISKSQWGQTVFRRTDSMLNIYARTFYLIATKYRYIPPEFVEYCKRRFARNLTTSLNANLYQYQSGFLSTVQSNKGRSTPIDAFLIKMLKGLMKIERNLAAFYCQRDFRAELDAAIESLRRADSPSDKAASDEPSAVQIVQKG